jgi:outer membrane immunogenic protein
MRRLVLTAVMIGAVSGAQAADMPDLPILRGAFTDGLSSSKTNWQGFYAGLQGGYGVSDENFNGSTSNMTKALLADTLIEAQMGVSQWNLGLGKSSAHSSGYGAFAGYNWQWDDVVLGLEGSYLHGAFGGSASATEARSSGTPLSDGLIHDVTATSSAAISISDMMTFRARAAYSFGCFMPYVFAGFALGDAEITRSISVVDAGFQPLSTSEDLRAHLIYGYTAGLGIDINLVGGLFMRAEWEYVRFTSQVDTNINTVRLGLAYKF